MWSHLIMFCPCRDTWWCDSLDDKKVVHSLLRSSSQQSQRTSVVPVKLTELLLCTSSLSTWLNPAFFFFFFLNSVLLYWGHIGCFILFVLSISIFYWGHCRLNRNSAFSSGIQKSNFLLKVFFSIKYFVEYIFVHLDTEWLRLKGTSVSSSRWQRPEKLLSSTAITPTNTWTVANSQGTSAAFRSTLHWVISEVGHFSFLPLFLSEPGIVPGAEDSFSLDQLLTFLAYIFISSIWCWSWRGA